MTVWLDQILATIHLLSSALWFGALVYRTFFVDPKSLRFLGAGSAFEHFSLDLAHGMRRVVLASLLACGLSGFMLMGLRWQSSDGWITLIVGKVGLWIISFAAFAYVSWVFWPRRVFATANEWNAVRRQGFYLSLAMIGVAALGMVLGQLSQSLRTTQITVGQ